MNKLKTPLVLLVALAAAAGSAAEERPWIMINEDADHVFHWNNRKYPGKALTREAVWEYLDPFLKPAVTHFLMALNNMNVLYESEVYTTRWKTHEELGCTCPQSKVVETMAATFRNGLDPYEVMIGRAREKGITPWLSMRMNDIHEVSNPETWKCFVSDFWRKHPEFRRVPTAPEKLGTPWADLAFDFSHEEVREMHLKGVTEMLEKYDADGFEFDWLRFERHLTPGKEEDLGPCITDFMHKARKLIDAAAKRRGHPIAVAARVASTPEAAKGLGTDALLWAKEGIVDVVIPCNFLVQTDYRMPLRRWLDEAKAANPKVKLVAGCDQKVTKQHPISWYNLQMMTPEEYYGWFELMLSQGATGFYFFNHFDIPRSKMKFVTTDTLTYDRVAGERRAYPLSWRESVPNRAMSERQLPKKTDDVQTLIIPIGLPTDTGAAEVLLGFSEAPDEAVIASVKLNGIAATSSVEMPVKPWLQPIDESDFDKPQARFTKFALKFVFPAKALKGGDNRIAFGGKGLKSVTIHACELVVVADRPRTS